MFLASGAGSYCSINVSQYSDVTPVIYNPSFLTDNDETDPLFGFEEELQVVAREVVLVGVADHEEVDLRPGGDLFEQLDEDLLDYLAPVGLLL